MSGKENGHTCWNLLADLKNLTEFFHAYMEVIQVFKAPKSIHQVCYGFLLSVLCRKSETTL